MTLSSYDSYGQQIIKGRIIAEDLVPLPGANVYDRDTLILGKTDIDGYFELELQYSISDLIIGNLGYEWTKLHEFNNCSILEVILLEDANYDYRSHGKIDRIRKNRFERIPEMHLKAYEGGIFKSAKPCYGLQFEPIKSQLDEIGRQMQLIKKQIKAEFEELSIGDTIKVPSESFSSYTDETEFGCLITATITGKNKKKGGFNLILRVLDKEHCQDGKTNYNGKPVEIGDMIEHNMKYFKILNI